MKFILTILGILIIQCSYSQQAIKFSDKTTIETGFINNDILKHFQQNFDFAIVYHSWSSWDSSPNFYILASKNNSFSAWRYVNRKINRSGDPKDSIPVRLSIAQKDMDSLWSVLRINNIAQIKDESEDLYGCFTKDSSSAAGKKIHHCTIYDADYNTFFILTPDKYRQFKYYAPAYFEKCCPGLRAERSKVLNVINAFIRIRVL